MSDELPPTAERSALMSRIRGRDTAPELRVRRALHAMGYRFRLQRRDLPGTPDIVLPRHRIALFVHGCFWHRHPGCRSATTPRTRANFWQAKFAANVWRDASAANELRAAGWRVVTIWECETRSDIALQSALGLVGLHPQIDISNS